MKKIIAIIFCLFISTVVVGQVSTTVVAQHLEFMGVPMQGTIEDFQKKLEEKGLEVKEHNPQYRQLIMQGMFFGKLRDVKITYTPTKHIPYEVEIMLGHVYDITKMMDMYLALEEKYRKYKDNKYYQLGKHINFNITNSELEDVGSIEYTCGLTEDDMDNKIWYLDYNNSMISLHEEYELLTHN